MPVTTTLERRRTSATALTAVVAASGLMVALALFSFGAALSRLIGALTFSAEGIVDGVSLPAAAFDGVSSGTLNIGRALITGMYDGNDVPLPEARDFAAQIQGSLVPFHAAETIDAALVLALSIVVLLLCIRLVRGRPFVRHMTLSLAAFAAILAVFSVAAQVVRRIPFADATAPSWSTRKDFAWYIATLQSPPAPNAIVDESFTYTPAGVPLPLDLTLVGVAVLIALVAAAFAIGQRMQRDVEGLV
jgi:hypothetical protein